MVLIGIAIYSLSQLNSTVKSTTLRDLALNPTLRQDLPHFEYPDQGKVLTPESFAGHWTLLTFWAHWCAPCLEEMPALNSLGQQWQGKNFEILTVNVDDPKTENAEAARAFLSEQEIALPTVFDSAGILKRAFAVDELPRHFLISPKKKIVWEARGAFRWNDTSARDRLMAVMADEAFPENAGESESGEGSTGAPSPAQPAPAAAPAK